LYAPNPRAASPPHSGRPGRGLLSGAPGAYTRVPPPR
jgi:hypothetical protein